MTETQSKEYNKINQMRNLEKSDSEWLKVWKMIVRTEDDSKSKEFENWLENKWNVDYIKSSKNAVIEQRFRQKSQSLKKLFGIVNQEITFYLSDSEPLVEAICYWGVSLQDSKKQLGGFANKLGKAENGISMLRSLESALKATSNRECYVLVCKIATGKRRYVEDLDESKQELSTKFDSLCLKKTEQKDIVNSLVYVYDLKESTDVIPCDWPRQILPLYVVKLTLQNQNSLSNDVESASLWEDTLNEADHQQFSSNLPRDPRIRRFIESNKEKNESTNCQAENKDFQNLDHDQAMSNRHINYTDSTNKIISEMDTQENMKERGYRSTDNGKKLSTSTWRSRRDGDYSSRRDEKTYHSQYYFDKNRFNQLGKRRSYYEDKYRRYHRDKYSSSPRRHSSRSPRSSKSKSYRNDISRPKRKNDWKSNQVDKQRKLSGSLSLKNDCEKKPEIRDIEKSNEIVLEDSHENGNLMVQPILVRQNDTIQIFYKYVLFGEGDKNKKLPEPDVLKPQTVEIDNDTTIEAFDWLDVNNVSGLGQPKIQPPTRYSHIESSKFSNDNKDEKEECADNQNKMKVLQAQRTLAQELLGKRDELPEADSEKMSESKSNKSNTIEKFKQSLRSKNPDNHLFGFQVIKSQDTNDVCNTLHENAKPVKNFLNSHNGDWLGNSQESSDDDSPRLSIELPVSSDEISQGTSNDWVELKAKQKNYENKEENEAARNVWKKFQATKFKQGEENYDITDMDISEDDESAEDFINRQKTISPLNYCSYFTLEKIAKKQVNLASLLEKSRSLITSQSSELILEICNLDKRIALLQDELKKIDPMKITNMYSRLKDDALLESEREAVTTYDSTFMLYSRFRIPESDMSKLIEIRRYLSLAISQKSHNVEKLRTERKIILEKYCDKTTNAKKIMESIKETLIYYISVQKALDKMEYSCFRSFFIDDDEDVSKFRKTMVFHQLYAYVNYHDALNDFLNPDETGDKVCSVKRGNQATLENIVQSSLKAVEMALEVNNQVQSPIPTIVGSKIVTKEKVHDSLKDVNYSNKKIANWKKKYIIKANADITRRNEKEPESVEQRQAIESPPTDQPSKIEPTIRIPPQKLSFTKKQRESPPPDVVPAKRRRLPGPPSIWNSTVHLEDSKHSRDLQRNATFQNIKTKAVAPIGDYKRKDEKHHTNSEIAAPSHQEYRR
ncbi:DgyrCDS4212 [Dimorphilus gyrociliatus]|uniref:DgyrCDS4212 n=1 Tax=Dimorphilus gyrociliatus TaxID=2664684 RepID=A0A7I8VGB0_9ANNE|nr:DgyrCDS4212 [Dimorphilus gyrociliatus]